MTDNSKNVNVRLDVSQEERDRIRIASAIAGYSSMAHFNRDVVLQVAELFQPEMPRNLVSRPWYKRLTEERKQWLIQQLTDK